MLRWTPLLALVSLVAGCRPSELTTFSDSLGSVRYERVGEDWELAADAPAALSCDDGVAPPVEGEWMIAGNHVVSICVLGGSSGTIDFPSCRPVPCGQCPSDPIQPILCEDGVCVRDDLEWRESDVMSVCARDVPRFTGCEDTAAYFAYLELVGGPAVTYCPGGVCSRPADCF